MTLSSRELFMHAYNIIEDSTPLGRRDCGELCGRRCCSGGDGDGMLLFPHEYEVIGTGRSADSRFFVCEGECRRSARPIACRIFPLMPHIENGRFSVYIDARAYRVCPLAKHADITRFDPDFVRAVRRAARFLSFDDECRAFIEILTSQNRQLLSFLPKELRSPVWGSGLR